MKFIKDQPLTEAQLRILFHIKNLKEIVDIDIPLLKNNPTLDFEDYVELDDSKIDSLRKQIDLEGLMIESPKQDDCGTFRCLLGNFVLRRNLAKIHIIDNAGNGYMSSSFIPDKEKTPDAESITCLQDKYFGNRVSRLFSSTDDSNEMLSFAMSDKAVYKSYFEKWDTIDKIRKHSRPGAGFDWDAEPESIKGYFNDPDEKTIIILNNMTLKMRLFTAGTVIMRKKVELFEAELEFKPELLNGIPDTTAELLAMSSQSIEV